MTGFIAIGTRIEGVWASQVVLVVKKKIHLAMQETQEMLVSPLGWEDDVE